MIKTTKEHALKLPFDHIDHFVDHECRGSYEDKMKIRSALSRFVGKHIARYHTSVSVSRQDEESMRHDTDKELHYRMVQNLADAIPEVSASYEEPDPHGKVVTAVTYFLSFKPMFRAEQPQKEQSYVGPW